MKRILFAVFCSVLLLGCKEEDPVVTAIKLDVAELELKIGESYDFKVSHTPPEAKAPEYEWSVTKYAPSWGATNMYDIATIDQNGKFTAIKVGCPVNDV